MTWAENLIILAGLALFAGACAACARTDHWRRAMARLRRDRLGIVSMILIGLYLFIGLLDSASLPMKKPDGRPLTVLDFCFRGVPQETSYSAPLARTSYSVNKPEPLKGRHLLGTDFLGKDVLLQTLKACRTALLIGGLTSLIYIPLGTLLGIAAGYYRRWVDDVIQYVYSTLASIPGILLLVAILMVMGRERKLWQISLALGITGWVGLCRLIRGEAMRQAARPYTEAARSLGQGHLKIILRHILPNVMHLVIINFVLGFSGLVLSESILSYIGVGAPVGTASWGLMIDSARMELSREPMVWWHLSAATLLLFFLVLSLNLLGDSLRRAFDPRAR